MKALLEDYFERVQSSSFINSLSYSFNETRNFSEFTQFLIIFRFKNLFDSKINFQMSKLQIYKKIKRIQILIFFKIYKLDHEFSKFICSKIYLFFICKKISGLNFSLKKSIYGNNPDMY